MQASDKNPSRTLADYVAGLEYASLPLEVVKMAKALVIDTIGVVFPATKRPVGKMIIELVNELGGKPEASVVGSNMKTSPVNAALANGTMAHDMELDEVHEPSSTHAAAVIIPAALAMAEAAKTDGKALITATVAGYDIIGRLGRAMRYDWQMDRGFHPSCTLGSVAAAAACAKVLNLNSDQTLNAIALGGCQAGGLMAILTETEHHSKSLQIGLPARNGVTAALLARKGYLGPPDILTGRYNLCEATSIQQDWPKLTEALGQRYEILYACLKVHASCRWTHAPLDAFLAIMKLHSLKAEDIQAIDIKVPESFVNVINDNELLTHNVQWVTSVVAHHGAIYRNHYSSQTANDPRIMELKKRVTFGGDPELQKLYPKKSAAIVTVRTKDGRTLQKQIDDAKGTPDNPFTDQELKEKFTGLVRSVITLEKTDKLWRELIALEDLPNVARLGPMLRGA